MLSQIFCRELDEETNNFIKELYDMAAFNFGVFTWEVVPHTKKSFTLTLGHNGKEESIKFTYRDARGVNGTFKMAKAISILA